MGNKTLIHILYPIGYKIHYDCYNYLPHSYSLIIILLQKSFNPICKIVHKKINFISPISTQNNTLPYSLFIVAIVILQ